MPSFRRRMWGSRRSCGVCLKGNAGGVYLALSKCWRERPTFALVFVLCLSRRGMRCRGLLRLERNGGLTKLTRTSVFLTPVSVNNHLAFDHLCHFVPHVGDTFAGLTVNQVIHRFH